MNRHFADGRVDLDQFEVGFDIPAKPGMDAADIQTPALVLDLDALERNIRKMGAFIREKGVRHFAHGKMHRSVDVAQLQISMGGASGVCCQKVAEAEVFARGGIPEIIVTNEIVDPRKIDRLARLPKLGPKVIVCVEDAGNIAALSEAAARHGTELVCYVELDVGMRRCGVSAPEDVVALARAIDAAPGLSFGGLQAYHGSMQHLPTQAERDDAHASALAIIRAALTALDAAGLPAEQVSGGGSGSFELDGESGVFTELQAGSYAFMDEDYGKILDRDGKRFDDGTWEHSLFLLSQVMSTVVPGRAVCDAGLKSHTFEYGPPRVFDREGLAYVGPADEHGILSDPDNTLRTGEKLRLVPAHCDPTCNLHDWYVGVRGDKVECLWPVSARGQSY